MAGVDIDEYMCERVQGNSLRLVITSSVNVGDEEKGRLEGPPFLGTTCFLCPPRLAAVGALDDITAVVGSDSTYVAL